MSRAIAPLPRQSFEPRRGDDGVATRGELCQTVRLTVRAETACGGSAPGIPLNSHLEGKMNNALTAAISHGHFPGFGHTIGVRASGLLLGIEFSALNKLLKNGSLDCVSNLELFEDDTLVEGYGIIFNDEKFDQLIEAEDTSKAFRIFLSSSFLVNYKKNDDQIELLSDQSLWVLLPKYSEAQIYSAKGNEEELRKIRTKNLSGKQSFMGTHYVCDFEYQGMVCGEPMCHAQHSWVENGLCLCYMWTGSYVTAMRFHAFRTVALEAV
jgi:hypothetical protein